MVASVLVVLCGAATSDVALLEAGDSQVAQETPSSHDETVALEKEEAHRMLVAEHTEKHREAKVAYDAATDPNAAKNAPQAVERNDKKRVVVAESEVKHRASEADQKAAHARKLEAERRPLVPASAHESVHQPAVKAKKKIPAAASGTPPMSPGEHRVMAEASAQRAALFHESQEQAWKIAHAQKVAAAKAAKAG